MKTLQERLVASRAELSQLPAELVNLTSKMVVLKSQKVSEDIISEVLISIRKACERPAKRGKMAHR